MIHTVPRLVVTPGSAHESDLGRMLLEAAAAELATRGLPVMLGLRIRALITVLPPSHSVFIEVIPPHGRPPSAQSRLRRQLGALGYECIRLGTLEDLQRLLGAPRRW